MNSPCLIRYQTITLLVLLSVMHNQLRIFTIKGHPEAKGICAVKLYLMAYTTSRAVSETEIFSLPIGRATRSSTDFNERRREFIYIVHTFQLGLQRFACSPQRCFAFRNESPRCLPLQKGQRKTID
jgi:hypothetical protein